MVSTDLSPARTQQMVVFSSIVTGSMLLTISSVAVLPAVAIELSPNPNIAGNSVFFESLGGQPNAVTSSSSFENSGNISFREEGTSFTSSALFNNLGSLAVEQGATATNQSTFENLGSLNLSQGTVINDFLLNNRGGINTQFGDFDLIVNNGGFNNTGSIAFETADLQNNGETNTAGLFSLNLSAIKNSGEFINAGDIVQSFEGGRIENQGTFFNRGKIDKVSLPSNTGIFVNEGSHNADGIDSDFYNNEASGIILNNGSTVVKTALSFGTASSQQTFNNKGLLKGSGTFSKSLQTDPAFTFTLGSVAPGGVFEGGSITDSVGVLTFESDVVFNGSSLDISIGGLEEGTSDLVKVVNGSAQFEAGTVNFSLLDGFDIASALSDGETKTFSFLSADQGISAFSADVDFSQLLADGIEFTVVQQGNDLALRVTKLAEPTTPTQPAEPTTPTEPVVPTEPVTPIEPVISIEPTTPTEPVIPIEPTTPTGPIVTPQLPSIPSSQEVPEPSFLLGLLALSGLSFRGWRR